MYGRRPIAQQHDVGLQLLGVAALGGLDGQRHAVVALARAGHLRAEAELDALPRQDALERLGDLAVHRRHDAVEEFHHRHLRAEPPPDAAEFKTDIAAADHHEMPGHLVQLQPAGRGDDLLLVHLDAGKRNALAAGGDDDVLRVVGRAVDVDLAGSRRCGRCPSARSPCSCGTGIRRP